VTCDELISGYNRYIYTDKLWSELSKVPNPTQKLLSKVIYSMSYVFWDSVGKLLPAKAKMFNFGAKIHKTLHFFLCKNTGVFHINLTSHCKELL